MTLQKRYDELMDEINEIIVHIDPDMPTLVDAMLWATCHEARLVREKLEVLKELKALIAIWS